METPIHTRLCDYHNENRTPFAMPGHKNMRGLDADLGVCDVTELSKTLNLMSDDKTVTRANELLSKLYGSKSSFILTCGSTSCVQTMILSCVNPGDTLMVTSDCHISVINICAITGIKIKMVKDVTEISPDIKAVFITSPNYYGVTKDIKAISELCHSADIPLMVDEAHGAHFTGRNGLPETAVRLGADMVCQSAHKTLNALTGAAYLHICSERVDINRIRRSMRAVHTTSPSYMIAASADIARATLETLDYTDIIKECNEFKDAISKTGIKVKKNDDPTRLVLDFSAFDTTGFAVAKELSEHFGIDVEMADLKNIVLIVTPYNRHSDFISLFHAIKEILSTKKPRTQDRILPEPPCISGVISPQDGWFKATQSVEPDCAVGRISAQTISVYPPGTAVVVTGERISEDAIRYIKAVIECGAEVTGISDGKIEVIL
ncbi:MAG: aminotransferase class I/II-fold pyridoxal phosphate-dependent enzyme [Clostridia bacterium]|nr:aminotransferase class I/II-fold pyridoxal phosphate-dependent enzyme [Clostridia bacterium]